MPSRTVPRQPLHEVEAFLKTLDHPLSTEARALRQIILKADSSIHEGIKWNVPSFRTSEWFATFHLRKKDRIGVILHFGAKKRDVSGLSILDPQGLLEWLAPDRAQIMFCDLAELRKKEAALTVLILEWIKHV